jgi:hypothetical protein
MNFVEPLTRFKLRLVDLAGVLCIKLRHLSQRLSCLCLSGNFSRAVSSVLALSIITFGFQFGAQAAVKKPSSCDLIFTRAQPVVRPPSYELEESDFIYSRPYSMYRSVYGKAYRDIMDSLGYGQLVIDFGSADGRALVEYLDSKNDLLNSPRGVGVTFAVPPMETDLQIIKNRLKKERRLIELRGQLFEFIQAKNIPYFDVGSDYFGPGSYTDDFAFTFNRYLQRMRRPRLSELYFASAEPDLPGLEGWAIENTTFIITKSGDVVTVSVWLSRQESIDVTRSVFEHLTTLKVVKKTASAQVGDLELVASDDSDRPPMRVFREIGASKTLSRDRFFIDATGERTPLSDPRLLPLRRLLRQRNYFDR